jgi:cytochrome c-type biogenesis protein CcmH/NrfG
MMTANDGSSPRAFVRIDARWAPILEDALMGVLQRYEAIHSAWAREHPESAESAHAEVEAVINGLEEQLRSQFPNASNPWDFGR